MRLACLLVFLIACGGSNAENPDAGDGDGDGDGDDPGYVTDRVGQLMLLEFDGASAAYATLNDRAPVPEEQLLDSSGDCALYTNPDCSDCEFPLRASAGTIALTGLSQDFGFTDGEFGYAPEPFPTGAELFPDSGTITATAPGADAPGFTVSAGGVAALAGVPTATLVLEDDADFEVTWTAAGGDARIQLALRAGWHGAPYEMMLLCETADDGALTIPQALIAQLPTFGGPALFQWPSDLTRYRRGVATTSAGPVELFVGSQRPVNWTHN